MANIFRRKLSQNVGADAEQVGTFTASTTTIVVGLSVTNITGSAITANVFVNDGSANTRLVVNGPISAGSSLVVIGGDQKLVLESGDSIYVQSSTATSIDAIMSIMEIV